MNEYYTHTHMTTREVEKRKTSKIQIMLMDYGGCLFDNLHQQHTHTGMIIITKLV